MNVFAAAPNDFMMNIYGSYLAFVGYEIDGNNLQGFTGYSPQVTRDFFPAWGWDAVVKFFPKGGAVPGEWCWIIAILDDSDQANALGYHDVTSTGLPLAKVFAERIKRMGLAGR
jgi:hypothetical protein